MLSNITRLISIAHQKSAFTLIARPHFTASSTRYSVSVRQEKEARALGCKCIVLDVRETEAKMCPSNVQPLWQIHSSTVVGVKGYSRRGGLGTSCVGMSRLDFQSHVCQAYILRRVSIKRERPTGQRPYLQLVQLLNAIMATCHRHRIRYASFTALIARYIYLRATRATFISEPSYVWANTGNTRNRTIIRQLLDIASRSYTIVTSRMLCIHIATFPPQLQLRIRGLISNIKGIFCTRLNPLVV